MSINYDNAIAKIGNSALSSVKDFQALAANTSANANKAPPDVVYFLYSEKLLNGEPA